MPSDHRDDDLSAPHEGAGESRSEGSEIKPANEASREQGVSPSSSDESAKPPARPAPNAKPVRPPAPGRAAMPSKSPMAPPPSRARPEMTGGVVPPAGAVSPPEGARVSADAERLRARPAAPVRPSAPLPTARPVPAPAEVAPEQPDVVEPEVDDDTVIVPAPDPSTFAPKKPAPKSAGSSARRMIELKRTIIPLLLVNSVALPALAGLWFLADPDEPIRSTGAWLPIALAATGVVTAGLAAWHMRGVKKLLASSAR